MVFMVTCHSCLSGKCDNCEKGFTQEGVLGGWMCACSHSEGEQEHNRVRHEREQEKWFRSNPTISAAHPLDQTYVTHILSLFKQTYDASRPQFVVTYRPDRDTWEAAVTYETVLVKRDPHNIGILKGEGPTPEGAIEALLEALREAVSNLD